MLLVLASITLVAALAVGGVYLLTKKQIDGSQTQKISGAIAQVVPAFDNQPADEMIEKEIDGGVMKIYPARKDGQLAGYAVETFTKSGFGGAITLMVGFTADGTIHGISVLSHTETPGLGDKIEPSKSDFSAQFIGKNPAEFQLVVKKDGGQVDAITASTISSRAYCDAVQRAYNLFLTLEK